MCLFYLSKYSFAQWNEGKYEVVIITVKLHGEQCLSCVSFKCIKHEMNMKLSLKLTELIPTELSLVLLIFLFRLKLPGTTPLKT